MAQAGFLLVDKEQGWTSHDVVAKLRPHLSGKVGHAGTLDPMATGLLVLAFGRGGTKLLRFVQGAEKEYLATAQFGVATDSLDADGSVIARDPMPIGQEDVEAILDRFRGEIHQIPPMVSARKVEGSRLYDLARQGKEVDREARPVAIHEIEITDFAPSDYPEVSFRVVCSTGTYVRTLADDMARALGGRAHLTALRRTRNGQLLVADARPVGDIVRTVDAGLLDTITLDIRHALGDLAHHELDAAAEFRVRNGARVPVGPEYPVEPGQLVAMVNEQSELVAVYRRDQHELVIEVMLI